MHSANSITVRLKRISIFIFALFTIGSLQAQDNSPFSRYGLGDLTPNINATSRSMGGITAGYSDYQSINMNNPASLANLSSTVFDLGGEISRRTLKSNTTPAKFTSTNTFFSYMQIGFPISSKKMLQKGINWGASFGLRPFTQINYKIETNERLPGVDSLNTLYEGTGGLNQANVSTGIRYKNFSIGVSGGYTFGNKDYSTKLSFINDTILYQKSNSAAHTQITGFFTNIGAQYDIKLDSGKRGVIRLGAFANLQQKLNANQDNINETVQYDDNGALFNIDTVSYNSNYKGKVIVPATYGFGFTYFNPHLLLGADFVWSKWSDYTFYGAKDPNVQDAYSIKVGGQYFPAKNNTPPHKYWSFVKYRAGAYFGTDYINLGKSRNAYGVTLGAGFPLTALQRNSYAYYRDGIVTLNAGIDIGSRGDKNTQSIRENVARFTLGVSMNASWFQRRKYD
ncbi:MAG: hypothetical protein JSU03_03090 [Bacteroidetes bacterium]|nr:hypothetical protein [Bacteroidota bacterium]MBS1756241.1 hypothetical protein [Bacteroidota bacterium]